MILFLACAEPEDPCAGGVRSAGGGTCSAPLTLEGHPGAIEAELRWPASTGGEWPAVVVVPGGFEATVLPVGQGTPTADNTAGVVSIHVNLAGPGWGDGSDDHRGPLARAAVAAAVAFVAGDAASAEGLRVSDLAPGTRTDRVVLAGHSNGGNLAVATLADDALDLPGVVGLVTFETPSAPQFVNVEFGAQGTSYVPGSCLALPSGLDCPFATESAALSGTGEVCVDLDEDQLCTPGEDAVGGTLDPVTQRRALSPRLRAMAAAEGLALSGYDTEEEGQAFWSSRDASALVSAMASLRPVPTIVLATEVDHVLTGLDDHPHVYGLYELLGAHGVPRRLNPGADWSGLGDENAPLAPYSLADPSGWLVPEEAEQTIQDLLPAAARELCALADGWGW